ncbi:TetR/AcrR family transcriptional regulator [Rhodococcus qingshengii]|uniref:TetR/AcrR family transcriptional regulator n=1 Tax=Rhodococcus qingshengii TaxID=334542 RepID=UPI00360349C2
MIDIPGPRERLIKSAIDLVRERGVAGTGITELLEHSNTARRSIYMHFPRGKTELIEESTRTAGQIMGSILAHYTSGENPAESLRNFIEMWKSALVASDFTAGCPIVAAALAGPSAASAPEVAADVFRHWENLLTEQLQRADVDEGTARSLATMAVCAVEGAVIVAISSRSVIPLDQVGTHLSELVSLHHGPSL